MLRDLLGTVTEVPEIAQAIDAIPTGVTGYDQWGFSPEQSKLWYSLGYWFYRYFHPEIVGIENVPAGRVLIVPNHSGQLPFDGLVIAVACLLKAEPPRLVRPMAERWFPTLPFLNIALNRAGVVTGDPLTCRNLLDAENAILVFPEGARGSGKPWGHRYRLVDFGRGFMRLALQTNAPIVPVSVVGAEESIISLVNVKPLAKLLHTPYAPISPFIPLLGPLAYVPLPTKFHITFGAPMKFEGPFDDEDEAVDAKVQVVKDRVQAMIDEGLATRRGIF
jgi:1-acyl-sn-glycerol-3-phosphate acyltransferase